MTHHLQEIQNRLDAIEAQYAVRVLYACEAGSRAWGFESKDSDFDVRFVYVKQNVLDYLSVTPIRDVIEENADPIYDICGWEYGKALRLGHAGNASLCEWFHSPIVYREDSTRIQPFKDILPLLLNPNKLYRCYQGMAKSNYREYLHGQRVRLKKYLYVLRPLLACEWLCRHENAVFPPVRFDSLWRAIVPAGTQLSQEIEALLRMKLRGLEKETGPRFPAIDTFIEEKFRLKPNFKPYTPVTETTLDRIYQNVFKSESGQSAF